MAAFEVKISSKHDENMSCCSLLPSFQYQVPRLYKCKLCCLILYY